MSAIPRDNLLSKTMTHDYSEQIYKDDFVMFINACFACSGQKEFYNRDTNQWLSIEFLHEYVLHCYRSLYVSTLTVGINHFNQGLIIQNLISHPDGRTREEDAIIRMALQNLPIQRALKTLEKLRALRINNRRFRAIVREFFKYQNNLSFIAVKYRKKVRNLARHVHLKLQDETGDFLFKGKQHGEYKDSLFESYRQAHYNAMALYDLPFTVAEGFAQKHYIPRDVFLENIQEKMTFGEKLRMQSAAERENKLSRSDLKIEIDLNKAPLTRLAIYILSLSEASRKERYTELDDALLHSARRAFSRSPLRLPKTAAVLDRSYSSSGSSEKKRRPLAIALGVSYFLRVAAEEYKAFWTLPTEELSVTARGETDLCSPLLDALEWGADLIIIISDGYENDPVGGASETIRVYRSKLMGEASVLHMNPVYDSSNYNPRILGPEIPTVGLRDAEDLPTMLGFAQFTDDDVERSQLSEYLKSKVNTFLHGH